MASRQAQGRLLTIGSTGWAPFDTHGWRPGTIVGLGQNRGGNTIVHLSFETGGSGRGRRIAGELYWRRLELAKGRDKPKPVNEVSHAEA